MGQLPSSEALMQGAETLAEVSVLRCRDGERTVSADVLAVEVPSHWSTTASRMW
jgi:hypothetical protein